MNQFKQRWIKEVKIDQLLQQKWMQAQVEPTQLFQFSLNKIKLYKEKKEKNYQLFT